MGTLEILVEGMWKPECHSSPVSRGEGISSTADSHANETEICKRRGHVQLHGMPFTLEVHL